MLSPNWSQNKKGLEFIEIWRIWYFKYGDLHFNVKNNFYEIFATCYAQIIPKIKNAQDRLKFSTFDISNIPVLILISKIIFMKYLPVVRPKLVPKYKSVHNLLKFGTFDIFYIPISILMSKIIFIKYLAAVRPR